MYKTILNENTPNDLTTSFAILPTQVSQYKLTLLISCVKSVFITVVLIIISVHSRSRCISLTHERERTVTFWWRGNIHLSHDYTLV